MSTYTSSFMSIHSDAEGTFFDVASSQVEGDVRICVGDEMAFFTPEQAREIAEALLINADRAVAYRA